MTTIRINWTEAENEILRNDFPNNKTKDVAIKLGKTSNAVSYMANKMGIKKSKEYKSKIGSWFIENLIEGGKKSRFKKGSAPANKGKKVSKEVYERTKHTFFQKGNVPVNLKYDGHERLTKNGFIMIRKSPGKYVLKHRDMWIQNYGEIPVGYVIVFKDKDRSNIVLENLEMISMSQNMLNNSIQNYPEEIKSSMKLIKKLNKIIYEKQNRRP